MKTYISLYIENVCHVWIPRHSGSPLTVAWWQPYMALGSNLTPGISVHFLSHFPAKCMLLINAVLSHIGLPDQSTIRTFVSG